MNFAYAFRLSRYDFAAFGVKITPRQARHGARQALHVPRLAHFYVLSTRETTLEKRCEISIEAVYWIDPENE